MKMTEILGKNAENFAMKGLNAIFLNGNIKSGVELWLTIAGLSLVSARRCLEEIMCQDHPAEV
jgi:hypothetical protein